MDVGRASPGSQAASHRVLDDASTSSLSTVAGAVASPAVSGDMPNAAVIDSVLAGGGDVEYPVATFRVLKFVSKVTELSKGTAVQVSLARNLYLVPAKAHATPPSSAAEFFKLDPKCMRLRRQDSELRFAAAPDAKRAHVALNEQMLFVRGMEALDGAGIPFEALLEADYAHVCADWAAVGQLNASWQSLLRSGIDDNLRRAAVQRVLSAVPPIVPATPATGKVLQAVNTLLGTRGRRAVLSGALSLSQAPVASKTAADVLGGIGEVIDQASRAPVVGPAVRLACLFVRVSSVAIQTDDHKGLCELAMRQSVALAHRLLMKMFEMLQLPTTEITSVHCEELSVLLGDVERLLEKNEEVILLRLEGRVRSDQTIRRWRNGVGRLSEKAGLLLGHCATGNTADRTERNTLTLIGMVNERAASGKPSALTRFKVGRDPPPWTAAPMYQERRTPKEQSTLF